MDVLKDSQDIAASYDEFFQQNYEDLRRMAMQITMYDKELSEDLVHDAYLRLNQKAADPTGVNSINSYLYVSLRNEFVSHLRRRGRINERYLPLPDAADSSGLTIDPRRTLRLHDQLRAICQYACVRKRTSIAASVLILRFVHGYYTAEVARIIKRSRNAVEVRLRKARMEVSAFLLDREREEVPDDSPVITRKAPAEPAVVHEDLLSELRSIVFSAGEGRCLKEEFLRPFYFRIGDNRGLERDDLSHLVSCSKCLELVNSLLKIPPLKDRHPLDTRGPLSPLETLQLSRSVFSIVWCVSAAFAAAI